jgi:cytochrome P450
MPSEESPPGPSSWSPFGQVRSFRRNPLAFLTRQHNEFGDFSQFRLLRVRAFLAAHPDYIRDLLLEHAASTVKSLALQRAKSLLGEGLLTSEPPLHTRQRRLMQPAFHHERLLRYASIMTSAGEEWLVRWRNMRLEDRTIDLHGEMMQLTLSIVVRALFTSDLAPVAHELSKLTTLVVRMFPYLISPFGEYVEHWPLPVSRRYRLAREKLDLLIYGLIGDRRAGTSKGDDLLSMLLAAQDQNTTDDSQMTNRQVRDELITLFLAGHETTANALTWAWSLLSEHPDVEARFHQELDSVLKGRSPDVADLPSLPYTNAVLSEALRLYPPAWGISRIITKEIRIAGYTLSKGSLCIASQWVTHRDSRFFPDPEAFTPERWLDAAVSRPRFAFFPFGAGSRICIGERFAWMEGTLLLALLGQKWRFRRATAAPVIPEPLITLRPKFGFQVNARLRTTAFKPETLPVRPDVV